MTVACGITAPVASATVPEIAPWPPICAGSAVGAVMMASTASREIRHAIALVNLTVD
jgi:hypothetical protein